jgi:hypothetical protein
MVRRWRLALLVLAGVVAAATTVLAVAVNVATGGTAKWFPPVERHPLRWTAGATAAAAVGLPQGICSLCRSAAVRLGYQELVHSWMGALDRGWHLACAVPSPPLFPGRCAG